MKIQLRCCGPNLLLREHKSSWLLSWRPDLPFWVPGADILEDIRHVALAELTRLVYRPV
jgi:hypothetical protein